MLLQERSAALKQLSTTQYYWVYVNDHKYLWDAINNRHVLDDKDSIGTYYGIICFINKKKKGEPLRMIVWEPGWPNDDCSTKVKLEQAKEFNRA